MRIERFNNITLIHGDCLEYMKNIEDNHYSLCIADPPYAWKGKYGRRGGKWAAKYGTDMLKWDKPIGKQILEEMFRVSENQVIWGGNYFSELEACRGFLIWDKKDKMPTMADCEFAWSSFDMNAKVFCSARNPGGITGKKRIHPTQKPVQLYLWQFELLKKHTKRVIDPFLGSGTSAVAAYEYGLEFTGIEISEKYFNDALERLKNHIRNNPKLI